DGAKHSQLGDPRLGQYQVLAKKRLVGSGNGGHAGILVGCAPERRSTSVTPASTRPAAPPLCMTAISKGHWKKMVVRPVNNWASSRTSISWAGPFSPGSRSIFQHSTPR